MATSTYTVGTTAKTIADRALPGGASTLICPSTNTDTVWADSTQVSAAVGIPITPGSTQPWPGDQPLFAWSATNGQQLLVAPGVDQGTNAGAIATALLAQGLPAAIAADIAVSGAPPIDLPIVLTNNSQVINSGVAGTPIGPLDVTKYSSLEIEVTESGATANTNITAFTVSWYADAATTMLIFSSNYIYGMNNGSFGLRTPIPRGAVRVVIQRGSATTTTAVTAKTLVLASMFVVPASSFYNDANSTLGTPAPPAFRSGADGLWAVTSGANVASGIWRPASYEGPAALNYACNGATQPNRVDIKDRFTQVPIASVLIPTTTTVAFVPGIILPRAAIDVVWTNSGTVATFNLSLVMTPWSA